MQKKKVNYLYILSVSVLLLAGLFILPVFSLPSQISQVEAEVYDDNGLSYDLIDNNTAYAVTGFDNSRSEVVIPSTYNGISVKQISAGSFTNSDSLKKVTIPASITTIASPTFLSSSGVFRECTNLTEVVFEENSQLKSIGTYAFFYCSSLTSITIPNNVTSIDITTFAGCGKLIQITNLSGLSQQQLYLPSNPGREIRNSTATSFINTLSEPDENSIQIFTIKNTSTYNGVYFIGCNKDISDLDLSNYNNVDHIYQYAFYNHEELTSITLPDSIRSIQPYAFAGCINLASINLPDELSSIERYAFADCINLSSIILPNELASIGDYVFYNCQSLASIDIPNSIDTIESYAFYMTGLTSIILPNSITSIKTSAFYGCQELLSAELPDQLISIGAKAFAQCIKLKSIVIPASVESILGGSNIYDYDGAFSYCSELEYVEFEENSSLTSIGQYAFYNCQKLETIKLTSPPPTLGTGAFNSSGINSNSAAKIFVPRDEIDNYKSATGWSTYSNKIYKSEILVTFHYFTGEEEIWDEFYIPYGESATAPENTARTGHDFLEWSGNYKNVTEDVEITAGYEIHTFEITIPAEQTNYTLTPLGNSYSPMNYGEDYSFRIKLDEAYTQSNVIVKSNGIILQETNKDDNGYLFIIEHISEDQTITVEPINQKNTYTITVSENSPKVGYTLIETGNNSPVEHGTNYFFKIELEPANTQSIITVEVNGITLFAENGIYSIEGITENIELEIIGIKINTYEITISSESPTEKFTLTEISGSSPINYGEDYSFKIDLNPAYTQSNITVKSNGIILSAENGIYTIENITEDIEISVEGVNEDKNTYTVIVPSEEERIGYTFSTNSPSPITHGETFSFTIELETAYALSNLMVRKNNIEIEGIKNGNIYTYAIEITEGTEISVKGVEINIYNVSVSQTGFALKEIEGFISPIEYGGTYQFKVILDEAYTQSQSITVKADGIILYAINGIYTIGNVIKDIEIEIEGLTRNVYEVVFKSYDGITLKTETVEHGSSATPPEVPSREAYTFVRWAGDGDYTNITKASTFIAEYVMNKFIVSFYDFNGYLLSRQEIEHGADAISPEKPTRIGYLFTGWSENYIKITGDLDVIARYSPIKYVLKFDRNTGVGLMFDQEFTYNSYQNLYSNTFTKLGYTFGGWNTQKDGSGSTYGNFQSVRNLTYIQGEVVILYAQWIPNTYTISFNLNYIGVAPLPPISIVNGDEISFLPTPEQDGYIFLGWYTQEGLKVEKGDEYLFNRNITLVASWEEKPFNFSLIYIISGGAALAIGVAITIIIVVKKKKKQVSKTT